MNHLLFGASFSAIKDVMRPGISANEFLCRFFRQHKIIISPQIREYYLSSCDDELTKEILSQYVDDCIQYDTKAHLIEDKDPADGQISYPDKIAFYINTYNIPFRIYIGESSKKNKQIKKRFSVQAYTTQSLSQDPFSPPCLYTLPIVTRQLPINYKCSDMAEWISFFFQGQDYFEIVDKYFFSSSSQNAFIKYFFPIMNKGSRIIVFTTYAGSDISSELMENIICLPPYSDYDIQVNLCDMNDTHERVIVVGKVKITLDRGIDVFNADTDLVRNGSNISICKVEKYQFPSYKNSINNSTYLADDKDSVSVTAIPVG